MPTNNFLPFAYDAGADVVTQSEYLALTTLREQGFATGTARTERLNKVWRQGTIMAAVLAQFICDTTGDDALDDGTTATLIASLKKAIKIGSAMIQTGATGGTANAITATYSPAPTAYVNGQVFLVKAASANTTTTPTFTPNSGTLAAKTINKLNGVSLAVGDIAGANHWLQLIYDSGQDKFVLLNPAAKSGFGTGQTYHDVTGSRTGGTTYTNSTGAPIWVSVFGPTSGNALSLDGYVDGNRITAVGPTTISNSTSVGFPVPPGSTYKVTVVAGDIAAWWEMY